MIKESENKKQHVINVHGLLDAVKGQCLNFRCNLSFVTGNA